MSIGKADSVSLVSNAQWAMGMGCDPQALGTVLQHNCRTGVVIGDGSMYADPRGQIAHVIHRKNPVHRCDWN